MRGDLLVARPLAGFGPVLGFLSAGSVPAVAALLPAFPRKSSSRRILLAAFGLAGMADGVMVLAVASRRILLAAFGLAVVAPALAGIGCSLLPLL